MLLSGAGSRRAGGARRRYALGRTLSPLLPTPPLRDARESGLDLSPLLPPVMESLQHRVAEVRAEAERCLTAIVGFNGRSEPLRYLPTRAPLPSYAHPTPTRAPLPSYAQLRYLDMPACWLS
eukprot:2329028-Rhodomonas_salina.5